MIRKFSIIILVSNLHAAFSQHLVAFARIENYRGVINDKNEFVIDTTFDFMYRQSLDFIAQPSFLLLEYAFTGNCH